MYGGKVPGAVVGVTVLPNTGLAFNPAWYVLVALALILAGALQVRSHVLSRPGNRS